MLFCRLSVSAAHLPLERPRFRSRWRTLCGAGGSPLLITCDDYYRQSWRPIPTGFDTVAAIDDVALCRELCGP